MQYAFVNNLYIFKSCCVIAYFSNTEGVSHDFELIEKEESNNVVELGLNESADTQMLCKTTKVNAVTHDGIQAESVDELVTAMHLLPTGISLLLFIHFKT